MVVITADHERQRVVVAVPAGTSWSDFHSQVRGVVVKAPELTDYDWIIDDQGPMDDVDVGGMAASGELFRSLSSGLNRTTFTIVVSTDRFFGEWARVIDNFYGNRRHYSAPTLESAIARLDQLARERPDV